MLRRVFISLASRAAVTFSVGVFHFHPMTSELVVDLKEVPPAKLETRISPVLNSLRDWNDARLEAKHQGMEHLFHEEDPWNPAQNELPRLIKSSKIAGRAVHMPVEEASRSDLGYAYEEDV